MISALSLKLLESPDWAKAGGAVQWDTPGAITFGTAFGKFYSGTNADCPGFVNVLGNETGITHYKLKILHAEELGLSVTKEYVMDIANVVSHCCEQMAQADSLDWKHKLMLIRGMYDALVDRPGFNRRFAETLLPGTDLRELATQHEQALRDGYQAAMRVEQVIDKLDGVEFYPAGRAWLVGNVALVSFWGTPSSSEMRNSIACLDITERDVWVQTEAMDDEQWTMVGHAIPALDPDTADKIKNLSALLHAATPEQKAKIRREVAELRKKAGLPQEDLGWGSKKAAGTATAAGYGSPAEFFHNSKTESSQLITRLLGD